MQVNVVTGDEILNVTYKDGSEKRFDSSDDRTRDFYDGNYELYNTETEPEINELENPNKEPLKGSDLFPDKMKNFTTIKSLTIWSGTPPEEKA